MWCKRAHTYQYTECIIPKKKKKRKRTELSAHRKTLQKHETSTKVNRRRTWREKRRRKKTRMKEYEAEGTRKMYSSLVSRQLYCFIFILSTLNMYLQCMCIVDAHQFHVHFQWRRREREWREKKKEISKNWLSTVHPSKNVLKRNREIYVIKTALTDVNIRCQD